jgi:hypothetical protein
MKKPIFIVLRVLVVLALLAIVGGGAFRMGYARGVTDSPAIAEQMQTWQKNAGALPVPYAFGAYPRWGAALLRPYPGPMMFGGYPMAYGHHFGFNPFGGILAFLFFGFLFFGAMRMIFFRRMMHHGWQHGHMPPWAQQPAPQAPAQPENPQPENK